MALLFSDGFDHYNSFPLKWTPGGNVAFSSTTRYSTGQSAWVSNGSFSNQDGYLQKAIPNSTVLTVGAACYFATLGPLSNFFSFWDGATMQASLQRDASNYLLCTRNGTQIGPKSSQNILAGTWNYIEFQVKIDPSVGYVIVRVNGVEWVNATGLNTRATGNSYANAVRLWHQTGLVTGTYFDDFYCLDDTGSRLNTFLGDVRVQAFYPNAAGDLTQFTPSTGANWSCVDEAISNGDTDYVASSTVGNEDTYNLPDIAGTVTVQHVRGFFTARKDDAGTRQYHPTVRLSGADYDGALVTLGDSYVMTGVEWAVNPATGLPWTQAEFNAAQFGVRLEA